MVHEAMSLSRLIKTLEFIRAAHGDDVPVHMADMEPVVLAEWSPETEMSDACVVITDLLGDEDEDEAEEGGAYPFGLDGVYELSRDGRIARRYAHLCHAEEALAYADTNGAGPRGEEAREIRRELELLRPYWAPGVTQEEAVAAYDADRVQVGGKS
jgi:hypothetical protein